VFGCGYRRIADTTCSATTLRRRRDEWISAGVAEQLRLGVLDAYDRMLGLDLEQLAVDGCTTKAPCGGQVGGPSPVDRRKQGLKRSVAVEAGGIPLAAVPAPANRRDDGLLAATLDAIGAVGPLPAQPVVHLDAGYNYQPCRQILTMRGMVGEIATRGVPARSTLAAGGGQARPCLGQPGRQAVLVHRAATAGGRVPGWRWPAPSSSVADWSAAPGPTTAGRIAHLDAHDHLLTRPTWACRAAGDGQDHQHPASLVMRSELAGSRPSTAPACGRPIRGVGGLDKPQPSPEGPHAG
jgi:hypothetical protein